MPIVLDASTALAWAFRDERDRVAERAIEVTSAQGALVPLFWTYEVANGLTRGERAGRISPRDRNTFVGGLAAMTIQVADASWEHVFSVVAPIALDHSLSVYDASYLELAIRERLPLRLTRRS